MNTPMLRYRTFDQLLSDAAVDMPTLHQEGFIEPAQLIKVALRVNYDLGLKIHQEKMEVLDILRGKARLPDDFYLLHYAAICARIVTEDPVLTGTQTEEVLLVPGQEGEGPCPDPCTDCEPKPCITRCGQHLYLKQRFKTTIRTYDLFAPFSLQSCPQIASGCPNLTTHSLNKASIRHGFLYTSFAEGTVFITYLGNLEDEKGRLLVPDHPLLNEYYEYAIKQRLFENMLLGGETVADKLTLIEKRLRDARNNALSIVNTPDFQELKATWEMNRRAMLQRYYALFY